MNLFRAASNKPELATAELEQELAALEKERDSGPPGEFMIDAFQRMGKEKYVRYVELRQIIKDNQFFTDSEVQARYVAGDHKFLVKLQMPEEEAGKHKVAPEEVGAVGEKAANEAGNFAFTGKEIAEHKDEWKVEISEL